MRSFTAMTTLVVSSILCGTVSVLAQSAATPSVVLNTMTPEGCFSSSGDMTDQGAQQYNSAGKCQTICVLLNKAVMGTSSGSHCWCGDLLPDPNTKVSNSECGSPCTGYGQTNCGGPNAWTVALTGTESDVGNVVASSSSSSAAPTPTPATVSSQSSPNSNPVSVYVSTVQGTQTVMETMPVATPATETGSVETSGSASKGPNKAGIAAGVVVGVVALAGILGGAWLFLRRRRRRAVEEEYRRNAALNNLTGHEGNKSTGSSSISDSRLEPSVMMQRRQSDGSIADNQDYSRRILKV
ncbi:MAG: hypothetical protein M1827_001639 [Pycnora praestabilis]|nr:MAG: hypothetical protein M1827_001639 [Pycnora praestabilis]